MEYISCKTHKISQKNLLDGGVGLYIPKDFILSLTEADKEALRSLYLFRCLDEPLLHDMCYEPEGRSRDYVMRRVRNFIKHEIVERVKYGGEYPALFLKTAGIKLLSEYVRLPEDVYHQQGKKTLLGVYSANDLKLDVKMINHQLFLNRFVATFKRRAAEINLPWLYFDEKYLSHYVSIRPDGMIRIGSLDLFLEMDMGTETFQFLARKWNNYRRFVSSDEYFQREQNIKVLFIIGNMVNPKLRSRRVKTTIINNILDVIDNDFDFFVSDQEDLVNVVFNLLLSSSPHYSKRIPELKSLLQSQYGFHVSPGELLKEAVDRNIFDLYIRKINEQQKIVVIDGSTQEFVVDFYHNAPLSVIRKITYMDRINSYFKNHMKRNLKYIVILEDEVAFHKDLKAFGIPVVENIYFTTERRLSNMQFYEALFQFDQMGNVFHFSGDSLNLKVFERAI